ncbi:hypothetical protein DLE04_00890 [Actinobacteria bacterium IMCC26103]|nr:hypothetical protein DLE04_00890 [Actinobacteria bacterium IMCC26103]
MNKSFLLVGTVSNVQKGLISDLSRIERAIGQLGDLEIFLVESDSTDATLTTLENLSLETPGFGFKSFGNLKAKYPKRTERIRFCRNAYVDYIQTNLQQRKWDYVIVADLDGMNSAITEKRIVKSLKRENEWDVCFANQTLGYYDLYALRADNWVEQDCFEELKELQQVNVLRKKYRNPFLDFLSAFLHFDRMRRKVIYKRMKRLKGDLIPVKSAFGGFGIYKPAIFEKINYSKSDLGGISDCEHLDLHHKCLQYGFRLVIDPRLINNHINVYNLNKFTIVRFLREYRKYRSRISN